MMIKRFAFVLLAFFALISCNRDPLKVDTSGVQVEVQFSRFDKAFFGTPENEIEGRLPELQTEFPDFFETGQTMNDWIEYRKDPFLIDLYSKVLRIHPDLSVLQPPVETALKHFNYYYPSATSKLHLYTYVSGLDYEFPVIISDTMSFIAIDMFLGADSVYDPFPQYLAKRFSPTYFPAKFARELAMPVVDIERTNGSFLNQMVYEGRVLYMMEAFLPQAEKHILIEYTPEELRWAQEHEQEIWTYFVEGELLFSNENGLYDRFIAEAPFSKFFKQIDRESPGRIGRWIGWQIVRAYMKAHPETSVQELAGMSDAQELFKNAQYKPLK